MSTRNEKLNNLIKEIASNYINKESGNTSLITVTNVSISTDEKHGIIFITTIPEEKETAALHFIQRNLGKIREYIKKNLNTKFIPFLEVQIDKGEKARQHIDTLLKGDTNNSL